MPSRNFEKVQPGLLLLAENGFSAISNYLPLFISMVFLNVTDIGKSTILLMGYLLVLSIVRLPLSNSMLYSQDTSLFKIDVLHAALVTSFGTIIFLVTNFLTLNLNPRLQTLGCLAISVSAICEYIRVKLIANQKIIFAIPLSIIQILVSALLIFIFSIKTNFSFEKLIICWIFGLLSLLPYAVFLLRRFFKVSKFPHKTEKKLLIDNSVVTCITFGSNFISSTFFSGSDALSTRGIYQSITFFYLPVALFSSTLLNQILSSTPTNLLSGKKVLKPLIILQSICTIAALCFMALKLNYNFNLLPIILISLSVFIFFQTNLNNYILLQRGYLGDFVRLKVQWSLMNIGFSFVISMYNSLLMMASSYCLLELIIFVATKKKLFWGRNNL